MALCLWWFPQQGRNAVPVGQVSGQFLTFVASRRHAANVAANTTQFEPYRRPIAMSPVESAASYFSEHGLELEPLESAAPKGMGGVSLDKFRIDPVTKQAMHSKGITELFPVQAQARLIGQSLRLDTVSAHVGCRASIRSTTGRT